MGKDDREPSRRRQPPFDYDLDFGVIDFRQQPELYRIGKGEQGVLLVEPYKSELLPRWRIRTPAVARESADRLYAMFEAYRDAGDFVGMDMARKFLQMGFTRARRYANHKSGRKWSPDKTEVLPLDIDPIKAEAAAIFLQGLRARQGRPRLPAAEGRPPRPLSHHGRGLTGYLRVDRASRAGQS